ncbi:MAG TPA: class I adenylate-forming enzyme family protein [Hyphomicrobiales bacterium]|nr:class I adenylate-forming enzyme family protein [Hyphomicrobiales bacterium]
MILSNEKLAAKYVTEGVWGRVTLDALLRRNAQGTPGELALVETDGAGRVTRSLTYAALEENVTGLAAFFTSVGLKPDMYVLEQMPIGIDAAIALFGALRAGLVAVPVSPLLAAAELAAIAESLGPKALVTSMTSGHGLAERMRHLAAELFSVRFVCAFGEAVPDGVVPLDLIIGSGELADPAAAAALLRNGNAADHVATVSWSEGSDGPMPLARSHNHWISAGLMHLVAARLDKGCRIFSPYLPNGLVGLAAAVVPWLLTGGTLVLHRFEDVAGLAAAVAETQPDHVLVPAGLEAPLVARLGTLEPSLALVHPEGGARARSEWAGGIVDIDRIGDIVAIPRRREHQQADGSLPLGKIGAMVGTGPVGFLEARLRGLPRKAGEAADSSFTEGEIILRGPTIPDAAVPLAEAAAGPAFDADGFLHSGIGGRLVSAEPAGFLPAGPLGDLILVAGTPVRAAELDRIYAEHEAVAAAAAVVVPDPVAGTRLRAVIVPQPGRSLDHADFVRWLVERGVAAHKIPVGLTLVERLPRTENGRIARTVAVRPARAA